MFQRSRIPAFVISFVTASILFFFFQNSLYSSLSITPLIVIIWNMYVVEKFKTKTIPNIISPVSKLSAIIPKSVPRISSPRINTAILNLKIIFLSVNAFSIPIVPNLIDCVALQIGFQWKSILSRSPTISIVESICVIFLYFSF